LSIFFAAATAKLAPFRFLGLSNQLDDIFKIDHLSGYLRSIGPSDGCSYGCVLRVDSRVPMVRWVCEHNAAPALQGLLPDENAKCSIYDGL
jgi:hypothetical protein